MHSAQAPGQGTSPESAPLSVILQEDPPAPPDEPLPTYRQALLDRAKDSRQTTTPLRHLSPINLVPDNEPRPTAIGAEARRKPTRVAVFAFFMILGFAIAVGGISRYDIFLFKIDNSGYRYVRDFSNPSPPYASLEAIVSDKKRFLGYTIAGTMFAYPFLFLTLLVSKPQIFTLPRRHFSDPAPLSQRLGEAQARKKRNHCMGICCGLSALYVIIVVMGIWGTIHLAGTRLDAVMEGYANEDWAANYILMAKTWNGSSAQVFSPTGINLGDVSFSDAAQNWTMSLSNSTISAITYSDPNKTQAVQLTAFCLKNIAEPTKTENCITGALANDPVKSTKGPIGPPSGEFSGDFNLTLSSPKNSLSSFNGTIHLRAGTSDYQGIGKNYAPLGYWYWNSTPIIHVIWNSTQNRACDGLRVNLSKQYEDAGLTLVGIVWEWWKLWSQNGGCAWDLNSDGE